ncbi:MAG TPA: hypothetical protein VMT24_12970 [Aggregatilineaceae bacterium]|nr:hypothetical protein [Aggregatilineaceae bacterium]
MASQLHQAVELAEAGRREEARQLLWQYLQTQPQNEVAWLWLATVAADQAEYLRALQEVLRINPGNQQAQQAMAQFQQQYGQFQRPAPAQYGAPQVSTPPPVPYGTPSQVQQVPPPSVYPGGPAGQPPEQRGYGTPLPQARPPVQVQVRTVEKRRGCLGCSLPGCLGCLGCGGCWQSCLVALLVLVVLPAVACGALSATNRSLGPFDLPASYLPDNLGRKTVSFTAGSYDVTLKVARSWFLVNENDGLWRGLRDMLDQTLPFENTSITWATLPPSNQVPTILETNPIVLNEGGYPIALTYGGTVSGNYQCSAIRGEYDSVTAYSNNLCGYNTYQINPGSGQLKFKAVDVPAQMRLITFLVPVDQGMATQWQVYLPEKEFSTFKDDIAATIDSAKVRAK